ncbi:nuclear protein localization protein 4 [Coelomomyces lativittatus]|nr:nuclear protein localization protein 4 [Coelomomyces lativittatus]
MKTEFGKNLPTSGISLIQAGLKHGDIVSIDFPSSMEETKNENSTMLPSSTFSSVNSSSSNILEVDPVNKYLESLDGLIHRQRDPNFCRHGDKGMCEYCSPLEPYDKHYMQANKIKHLSFHSYLRKLLGRSSLNKKTSTTSNLMIHPLSPISYRIPSNCTGGHAPWPAGICSKCQPSAISLQLQTYRMVDHVEVESPEVIDRFLYFWRRTGYQRFAFLFGKYLPYDKVPLGMKVVVCALYEPPQTNALDGLELTYLFGTTSTNDPLNESKKEAKREFENAVYTAQQCGLQLVGMAFTDLEDDHQGTGKVLYKRHEHSFFLSGLEVKLAAYMQQQHPCSTPYSSTGTYGSRFVTVVVSGNAEGGIELEAYMVSETAVAMFDANLIEPSTSPSLLLVTDAPYVPDILYTEKNEYGTQVSKKAAPSFPCDYLLVNLTHGFPSQPTPQFLNTYPIEHRFNDPQSITTLQSFLQSGPSAPDFHFLLHLRQLDVLPHDAFQALCHASTWTHMDFSKLQTYLHPLAPPSPPLSSSSNMVVDDDPVWSCSHCTFHNPRNAHDCEMCGLPK